MGNNPTRPAPRSIQFWPAIGAAAFASVGAVAAVLFLPAALYPSDQADARATLQSGLLTVAAATIAVAGGLLALIETRRANRNTHVRELFTQAVEQLGSENITVRLGGMYALERVARDSPTDQGVVVEVLSAFVRTRSTDPALRLPLPSGADGAIRLAADVRGAMQVLARLPRRPGIRRASLTGADLTGPASLSRLSLSGGDLASARIRKADLAGAHLTGTSLVDARLRGASLIGADLEDADLTNAHLHGADLTGAVDVTQRQVDSALGDQNTRLPNGLARPARWER